MSVKSEQPLDELIVQVWLLYDYTNFKYCTSYVSHMAELTDGQTIQLLNPLGGNFHLDNDATQT